MCSVDSCSYLLVSDIDPVSSLFVYVFLTVVSRKCTFSFDHSDVNFMVRWYVFR